MGQDDRGKLFGAGVDGVVVGHFLGRRVVMGEDVFGVEIRVAHRGCLPHLGDATK